MEGDQYTMDGLTCALHNKLLLKLLLPLTRHGMLRVRCMALSGCAMCALPHMHAPLVALLRPHFYDLGLKNVINYESKKRDKIILSIKDPKVQL